MPIYDANGNVLSATYDASGNLLRSVYDANGTEYEFNSPYLTVMTFNVQGWSGVNSIKGITDEIFMVHKPDLVGLQECSSDGGYVPSYFRKSFHNTLTKSQLRVFTNIPYSNYQEYLFTEITETRGYQKFKISVGGKNITVFNVHCEVLQSPTPHYAQYAELLDLFDNETSFIALGDFNHEGSSRETTDFTQPLIAAGYNMANWGTETGYVNTWFNNATPTGYMCPCDNIITSSDIEIISSVFDQTKINAQSGLALDHIPVVARLKVN